MTKNSTPQVHYITKEELKHLVEGHGEACTLIDVRTAMECQEPYPMIPTAHNIPYSHFYSAFKMDDEEFKRVYGFKKPGKNDLVVLYCHLGARSAGAARHLVVENGYTRVFNYRGGAGEWYQRLDYYFRFTMSGINREAYLGC